VLILIDHSTRSNSLLLRKILLHILSTEHVRINRSDNYLHIYSSWYYRGRFIVSEHR